MGSSTDLRFRASAMRFLIAVVKQWWVLVPGGLLGAVDVVERLTGLVIDPPTGLIWIVLFIGFVVAVLRAFHDLRTIDVRQIESLKSDLGSARTTAAVEHSGDSRLQEAVATRIRDGREVQARVRGIALQPVPPVSRMR